MLATPLRRFEVVFGAFCNEMKLCRDAVQRQVRQIGAFAGVFDGDGQQVAVDVDFQQGVFVEVFKFRRWRVLQFNVQGVGVGEIVQFHGR